MNPNLEVDITPRLVLELKMRKIFLKLWIYKEKLEYSWTNKNNWEQINIYLSSENGPFNHFSKKWTKIGTKFYWNFTAEFPSAIRTSAWEFLKWFLRICIELIDPISQTPCKSYSCKFSKNALRRFIGLRVNLPCDLMDIPE